MGLPPRSSFLWGENYENTLTPSYPLDEVAPGRMPRDGSEWAQAPSGVEEASLVGHDYTLDGIAQWITRAEWSGALGVQAFLDWARDKNTFRFVPDVSAPSFYVDGCYLAGDMRSTPKPTTDSSLSLPITIRHPSVDLGLALRGLMFEYVPGASLTDPQTATFARASTAYRLGNNGLYASAASGALRDRHYENSVRTTLLEKAATNVVLHNRDLTNAAWTKTNVTAAKDQTGIDGVTNSASRITASAGNGTCLQAITLASSARFQSAFVKRLVGSGTIEMTMDNGATWTPVTVTSSWTRVTIPTQTLADPTLGFRIVTNSDSIAVDVVQNEGNQSYASSPIAVTTVAVTRAGDDLSWPHLFTQQAMGLYLKLRDVGFQYGAGDGSTNTVGMQVGVSGDRITIEGGPSNGYVGSHFKGSSVNSTRTAGTFGDTVELLCIVNSDGSVQLVRSLNAGADSTGTQSAALAFAADWLGSSPKIHLGGISGSDANRGLVPVIHAKVYPLTYAGVTRNTIALARVA